MTYRTPEEIELEETATIAVVTAFADWLIVLFIIKDNITSLSLGIMFSIGMMFIMFCFINLVAASSARFIFKKYFNKTKTKQ